MRPVLTVSEMRCEYAVNPRGIDVARPRLSWMLASTGRGQMQAAYRVLVASSAAGLEQNLGDQWDSGKVDSDRSVNIVYQGKPLASRKTCWWKVRCWNQDGSPSAWSKPATFEMGLLAAGAWKAKWIGMGGPGAKQASPLFRKEVDVTGKVERDHGAVLCEYRRQRCHRGRGLDRLFQSGDRLSPTRGGDRAA